MREGVWPCGVGRAQGEAENHPSSCGGPPSLPGGESGCLSPVFWSFSGSKLVFSSEGFILLVTGRELAGPGQRGLLPLEEGWIGVGACPTYLGACTPQLTFGSLISSCWPSCCERPCSPYPLGLSQGRAGGTASTCPVGGCG